MTSSRSRYVLVGIVAGLALVITLLVGVALAEYDGANLDGSFFEIDNDANLRLDDPTDNIDWGILAHIGTNPPERRRTDAPTGQGDDSYKGGTKEDTVCPGETTGSIPNNKSDLLTFHVYTEPGDPGFVNIAWSRVSDPSGTTLMDFEFNQSGTACPQGPNYERTEGDLLIEYAIDQGGARANITGRFWDGTAMEWSAPIDLVSGTGCNDGPCAAGTINQSVIPDNESDDLGEKQPRTFGEAQINLDFIFDENKCTSFGSAMLKSRSSDSFTSQLKDFIRPIPVNITNCGTVIIHKQTDPDKASGSFLFTPTLTTDPVNGSPFSLSDNGIMTISNVLASTGYAVEEADPSPQFELIDINCDNSSSGLVTDINVPGRTVTFDMVVGGVVECTFTNRERGKLIVEKQTLPDGSLTEFDFEVEAFPTFKLTDGVTNTFDVVSGTYTISETVPLGWDLTDISCDSGDSGSTPVGPSSTGTVHATVNAGQTVTCVFTNTQRSNIVVDKVTFPAGSDQVFDFKTDATETGVVASFTLTDTQTPHDSGPIVNGTYTVTETLPGGWIKEASCDNGDNPEASINLGIGVTVTCTFTNTQLGTVIINKLALGADGDFDFTTTNNLTDTNAFSISGTDGVSVTEQFDDVTPGYYEVGEIAPTGWKLTDLTCEDGEGNVVDSAVDFDDASGTAKINVDPGETVECTFENTKQAVIIIEKQTLPEGSAKLFGFAADYYNLGFNLSDGQSDTSGNLTPGQTYLITETVPAGWQLDSRVCVSQAGPTETSYTTPGDNQVSVTPKAGQTIKCTFTNSTGAIKISKTTKKWNVAGGVPLPGAVFSVTLDADGSYVGSFTTDDNGEVCVPALLNGEDYTITEVDAPAGFDPELVDPATGVSAAAAECGEGAAGTPTPVPFVNDPLSAIKITFYSLARLGEEGLTVATQISCVGPAPGSDSIDDSTSFGPTFEDGESATFTNLIEGTYTCTIVVDP